MEKYGEIPKRWTKEWWDYFWDYYKWHTISIIVAVIMILITAVQCANRVEYDVVISYVGNLAYTDKHLEDIKTSLSPAVADINGDGRSNVNLKQMNIGLDGTAQANTEFNSGMITKVSMEFITGDTYIFLFNKQEIDRILNRDSDEEVFVPVNNWSSFLVENSLLIKKNGYSYAVNLKGNKFLEENKFVTDDLYMAIRNVRPADKDKPEELAKFEEAKKLANYILNY